MKWFPKALGNSLPVWSIEHEYEHGRGHGGMVRVVMPLLLLTYISLLYQYTMDPLREHDCSRLNLQNCADVLALVRILPLSLSLSLLLSLSSLC